jgi:phage baseplate assembly protein W
MSTPLSIQNRYKDLDISFRKNPNTRDIYNLTDIEAVKRSVKLLILTNFGERKFRPDLGSTVYYSLFENLTPITKLEIKRSIRDVINNFEPRARLIEVKVKELESDPNSLNIEISFYVVNILEPVTIRVNLERIR